MRLLSLGLDLVWSAVAVGGFFVWQALADRAMQTGAAPRLLDIFPMVLLPGTLAAFSLVRVLRREQDQARDDTPRA